jgi:PAS domain S-box-containing protein
MQNYQPVHLSAEAKLLLQAQVLDGVEQAIMAVDLTGRIVFWNRYAETLSGWAADETQGRSINEVLGTTQLMESVHANLAHLNDSATGTAAPGRSSGWSGEFLIARRSGVTFMAQLSFSLIQIEQQSLISMAAISREGTEPQQIQEVNRLLAEASALLVDAVDTEAPLTTMAQLAVPHLADWCAVHLLQEDGSIEQVALAPAELAAKQVAYQQAAHEWLQNHLTMSDTDGLPAVFRSSEPKLVADAASDVWAAAASIKSYMIVPLIAHPKTLGAITFVAAESGRCFDRNALALAENLASHIAIYLDNVRLYGESQRLNAELELRVNERTEALLTAVSQLKQAVEQLKQSEAIVQTLFRISNKLNATLEVSTILDELAQEAIRIVNGESGFAGLRTEEGMTVRKYFRHGIAIPFTYTWPIGKGIPGWVLKHKVPYGTSDAAHDPVIEHDLVINAEIRSIICTPILDSMGEVLGYFDIHNKQGEEGFTIGDQEMLMALAPAASIAIQNALAYQQRLTTVAELKDSAVQLQALAANLESAREEERTRIAGELHDQLGQALTAMKYDLAWLSDRLAQKDVTLAEKAKTVTAQMDTMIKTVRRISTELRPGMLDDLGLAASIEWQARDFEKRTGIICVVHVPAEDIPLPRAQSVALFRIFQEALTNVARHAEALLIEVRLEATSDAFMLQVQDDGRGILAQEIAGLQSLGMLGMRERAKRLGGTFNIQGLPGHGTIVTVSIPVKQSE